MIISLQQLKGGAGKTTLALHIAAGLAQDDARVLFVDADSQGSAQDWATARSGKPLFQVISMHRPTIHQDLPKLARGFDHVVIDTPPRIADVARSALAAADLVVLPVQPSPLDVWALDATIKLVKEAQVILKTLKSAIAINRKIVNTAIGRDVTDALQGYGVPILKAQVAQRIALAESLAVGSTALETDPHGAAAGEIRALVAEIRTLMEK